jgi:hypothetical protein
MFPRDTEATRQFVREHQATLKQDWRSADPARRDVVASRGRRHRRLRLSWLRTHLRPANHTS